ncbi:MAG: HAD family phosphatase [Candidatus Woesearchaeota archaeon]
MEKVDKTIQLILFDFGGVLYNIDHSRTIKAFSKLSTNPKLINNLSLKTFFCEKVFLDFEKGLIEADSFRKKIREIYSLDGTDEEFDESWNSTLIGPKINVIKLIQEIKSEYRIALLSNTNEIHCEKFSSQCKELLSLFEILFYSFQIHLRKPERAIFEYVISKLGIPPANILFVDDSNENIESAKVLSFKTFLISKDNSLEDLRKII